MSRMDESPHRLTTFPVAFPEEEEKTQVNQVISSLFSKVRSRWGPATPGPGPSSVANSNSSHNNNNNNGISNSNGAGYGAGDERDYFQPGSPPQGNGKRRTGHIAGPLGILQTVDDASASTSSRGQSGPSSPTAASSVRPGLILRPPSNNSASASHTTNKDSLRPPSMPRSLSSRPAPAPAPPLVSTTPIIRTYDFAHYLTGGVNVSPDNLSIAATGGAPSPKSPSRNRPRSGSNTQPHPHYHRHKPTNSASSITRFRKPSLPGSLLASSASSTNLAASFYGAENGNAGGNAYDFTAVPGFSIADDARSIRTVDTSGGGLMGYGAGGGGGGGAGGIGKRHRESKDGAASVAKIIRRLRGEGLSKTYWMADENCKECYDCKSVFSAWRRKHHCRVCGQIFCSRCAPNIIKGYRFGVDGMVRVCNLCLELMNEYDDDDDRRSINSNGTSVLLPVSAGPVFHVGDENMGMSSSYPNGYSQSPFAASHLFRQAHHHNDSLGAIRENGWRRSSGERPDPFDDADSDDSTPGTPLHERMRTDSNPFAGIRHPLLNVTGPSAIRNPAEAAPFRRTITEEEIEVDHPSSPKALDSDEGITDVSEAPSRVPSGSLTKGPSADPVVAKEETMAKSIKSPTLGGMSNGHDPSKHSTIAFPTSAASNEPHSASQAESSLLEVSPTTEAHPHRPTSAPGALRTRLSSRMSVSGLSGVLLSDVSGPNGVWRNGIDPSAKESEVLPPGSLAYFRKMLRQILERESVPKADEWEDVLIALLLKMTSNVAPVVRAGDSMDARTYVKIKKIPGGRISQSEYVDGTVITKNLEHKQMARHMLNPRIMVLTFPLDYHRVDNQLVSLDPLLAQERNYLKHLTKRVTDVRPHIVLVERNVSRLALDFLMEAKVAVARGVKPSAIQQVARCTQADIIVSMDRLALEPRLGRCTEFKVQTYEHKLIPGYRKTFLRFEGCQEACACTIIIRGADLTTLQAIKRITDFLVLIVNNLKMEVCLFYDEFNIFPPAMMAYRAQTSQKPLRFPSEDLGRDDNGFTSLGRSSTISARKDRLEEQEQADRQSAEIAKSLEPYLNTAISSSAAIVYPPPAPLAKMGLLDRRLRELRLARDEAEAEEILREESKGASTPKPSDVAPHAQTPSQSSDSKVGDTPLAMPHPDRGAEVNQFTFDTAPSVLRSVEEIKLQSDIAQTEFEHAEHMKLWSWYLSRNPPNIQPELFQGINYLAALVCEGGDKPCAGPKLTVRNFYMEDDCTLGQYLESLALEAAQPCPNKSCAKLQLHHFQVLVHDSTRLQIALDQFPCPSPGNEDNIITWSYCKLCKEASPTAIIKEETWNISWAKYLEHAFYPPATRAGFACPHDMYRDQIRYFALRNLAIRIHNELVDVYEVIRPSLSLAVRQESRVVMKNQEYEVINAKSTAFFDSVALRIRTFDSQLVPQDKMEPLRAELGKLFDRSMADRLAVKETLDRTYKLSAATDVLALNVVYRSLQDLVVQWDIDFHDLDKAYLPSEKDIRRMTANHLKKLFAGQDLFSTMDRSVSGQTVTETDESVPKEGEEEKLSVNEDDICGSREKSVETSTVPTLVLDASADPASTPIAENGEFALEPDSHERNSASPSPAACREDREYDSDSTISALPRTAHRESFGQHNVSVESSASGADTDHRQFASRLPRRSRPAPSVAELVRRFQTVLPLEDDLVATWDSVVRAASPMPQIDDRDSDSDVERRNRPRLKRGRTEGTLSKGKPSLKAGTISDGDRSYAMNASRIPTLSAIRRPSAFKTSFSSDSLSHQSGPERDSHAARKDSPRGFLKNLRAASPASDGASPERRLGDKSRRQRAELTKMGKGKAPARLKPTAPFNDVPPPLTPNLRAASKRANSSQNGGNRVSTIARHFDRLSREAERDRQRRMNQARGRRARPVAVTKAKVHVYSNARDAFRDDDDDSASSEADDEHDDELDGEFSGKEDDRSVPTHVGEAVVDLVAEEQPARPASTEPIASSPMEPIQIIGSRTTPTSPTFEPSSVPGSETHSEMSFKDRLQITLPPFETSTPLLSVPPTPLLTGQNETNPAPSQMSESEGSTMGTERTSILKTLSNLWAFRTGETTMLEYPFSASEHIFADSDIIVREDEPTSIIAFTLASKTYRDKLRSVAQQQRNTRKQEGTEVTSHLALPAEDKEKSATRASSVTSEDIADADENARREGGTHINYDFESGNSTISCRIFYAERFAALRSNCGCEDRFIDSLARCIKWDSSGGKSGSAFLKTRDDRFIAKEVSRLEMDALTKFAPSYFEYMNQSIQHNRPTALAKIYGCFKIGYRNATSGKLMRMNVVIMENLFYERRFERIYDLKGSMRNRLVQATGKENQVLLDENLVEVLNRQPLYMRQHSKQILRTAIWNDTLFLAGLNVMDYSLVVGVDVDNKELVVGVVDYIRTYTWDKKLESWVKDLGGGGRGEPTIVTPKQYKTRFRTAMERYFPSIPDRWTRIVPEVVVPATEEDVAQAL